ncbi:MAG: hypothetical protein ACR2JJ_08755 [Sphingomicrobium sp.]
MRRSLLPWLAAGAALFGLGACGNRADLRPAEGQALPVKPLMARTTPTADELLTPPAYANPDRVDELMKDSAPRQTDRFDLPPPSGQAPEVTVHELDEEQTDQVGPVTPE